MALIPGRRRWNTHRGRSSPGDEVSPSDEILLQACKDGDTSAFATLFSRHHDAVVRIAAATSSTFDPEDLAAESFTRIWAALCDGGGPSQSFLAYARTVVRNVAATWSGRSQEVPTEGERLELESRNVAVSESFEEALTEHQLVSGAFSTLPGRWQSVLWMTEVEGKRAADIASELDLTPNAAAALSKRAREALSRAWLQAQVDTHGKSRECKWVLGHIGGHVRRSLSSQQQTRVETHLESCDGCERATRRLAHIGSSLRLVALLAGGGIGGLAAWAGIGAVGATPAVAAASSGALSSTGLPAAATATSATAASASVAGKGLKHAVRHALTAPGGATVAGVAGIAAASVIVAAVTVPRLLSDPDEASQDSAASITVTAPAAPPSADATENSETPGEEPADATETPALLGGEAATFSLQLVPASASTGGDEVTASDPWVPPSWTEVPGLALPPEGLSPQPPAPGGPALPRISPLPYRRASPVPLRRWCPRSRTSPPIRWTLSFPSRRILRNRPSPPTRIPRSPPSPLSPLSRRSLRNPQNRPSRRNQ